VATLRGLWRTTGILIPFLVLFITLAIANANSSPAKNLVVNILYLQAPILIIAAAGTLVLIAGGLDLSVAATFVLAEDVAAGVALHSNPIFAVILALLCGAVVGLVNGFVVAYLRINALIATLAMSFVVAGIAEVATNNTFYSLFDRPSLASSRPRIPRCAERNLDCPRGGGDPRTHPLAFDLRPLRVRRGRQRRGGPTRRCARLARSHHDLCVEWNRRRARGRDQSRQTLTTTPYSNESSLAFTVLAGIVVGGTSIVGGDGSVTRTVIGTLFIALIQNGFDLLQFNTFYIPLVTGVILIVAVSLDVWLRQRRR